MEVAKWQLKLTVNGEPYELWIKPKTTLFELLRNHLGLYGTKMACTDSSCGACTVILDGLAVKSCSILALQAAAKEVVTIEGLAQDGQLHPLQKAFIANEALQCGFCTPGMLLSAKALLDENPQPTEEEVRRGIEGNLCRCTGYKKCIEAILNVAYNPERWT